MDHRIRLADGPRDVEAVISLHASLYQREHGWGDDFARYVRATFDAADHDPADRLLWVAEADGRVAGSVGLVLRSSQSAQLRWFLMAPEMRGRGMGRKLLRHAVDAARNRKISHVYLWTERSLRAAAHLYEQFGFRLTESKPAAAWGVAAVEEKYELTFAV